MQRRSLRLGLAALVPLAFATVLAVPSPASAAETPGACVVTAGESSCDMLPLVGQGVVSYAIVSNGTTEVTVDALGGVGCTSGRVATVHLLGQGGVGTFQVNLQPLCPYRLTVDIVFSASSETVFAVLA